MISTYFIKRFRMCGQRGGSTDISYSHATGLGCDYPIAGADAVARAHRRDLHEAEDVDFFRVADQCDFGETRFQFLTTENCPPRLQRRILDFVINLISTRTGEFVLTPNNLWIFRVAEGRRESLTDGLPSARPLPLRTPLHVLDGLFHKKAAERHGGLCGVDATFEPGAFGDEGQREHATVP